MKRSSLLILAAMVLLATVFTLLLTAPSPVSAGVNLILNPGFEEPTGDGNQPPAYWTPATTSLFRDVPPNVHSGNFSAYLHEAAGYYEQTVSIEALAGYRFVAYIKASNATVKVGVMIEDSNHDDLLVAPVVLSGNQTVWAKRLIYLPTLDTAAYAVITLSMDPEGGDPKAWFDDILLEKKAECFIATAAYGTETAEQLDVLRAFRDQVLLQSPLGSRFVAWYYQASPPLADFISESNLLRTVVRELLIDPMVGLAKLTRGVWGD